ARGAAGIANGSRTGRRQAEEELREFLGGVVQWRGVIETRVSAVEVVAPRAVGRHADIPALAAKLVARPQRMCSQQEVRRRREGDVGEGAIEAGAEVGTLGAEGGDRRVRVRRAEAAKGDQRQVV